MWKKLCALSIGQSPRQDLVKDILSLRPEIEIVHVGALDGFSFRDIPPSRGNYPIITRLNSGELVSIERDELSILLQKNLNDLGTSDVDAILVLCTGDFPDLVSVKPLIIPYKVFTGVIQGMGLKGRVGIICPLEEQKRAAEGKWCQVGFSPLITIASPFVQNDIQKAGCALQNEALDLVILDCYGHGENAREELSRWVMCPVLSIRTTVVSILAEFLG